MVRRIYLIIALITALIGLAILPAAAQSGRVFYIDYSGGSNSNPGTQSSPWKTHPYMQAGSACTGTGSAPSYAHQAGDHFVFKGGVTWPAACFEMSIPAGGTSSASDYYGVDQGWYSGASFSSPLFDLAQEVPTGNHVIVATSSFPGYVTFDNFEIANQGLTLGTSNSDDAYNFTAVTGSMPGVTIENGYLHDWVSNTNVAAFSSGTAWPYSAGSIDDGHDRITVNHMKISDAGGWVYSGGTKITGGYSGGCVNCGEVKNSLFHDLGAACFTVNSCHDNEFYNFSQSSYDLCPCRPHSQIIEDDWTADASNPRVYNNYLHDSPNVGVSIYVPYHADVYNNVLRNTKQYILLGNYATSDSSAMVGHVFNNTADCSSGGNCLAEDSKGAAMGTLHVQNNQWITNGTPTCVGSGSCSAVATLIQSNNVTMSASTATSQGFTSTNLYQPTSSTNATVGAGLSLAGLCSGNLVSLCDDRLGNPRLTSWDAGAYEFGSQSSSKPNPPTDLTASVQ